MSQWEDHDLEAKIVAILHHFQYDSPDHFGQPFVSAYQLAIALAEHHPDTFRAMNLPIGGRDTGESSLAQYLARELSRRINGKKPPPIEAAWFRRDYVSDITFNHQSQIIAASNVAALSLFRLKADSSPTNDA